MNQKKILTKMKKFISDIKTESTKLIQNTDDELNLKIEKMETRHQRKLREQNEQNQ